MEVDASRLLPTPLRGSSRLPFPLSYKSRAYEAVLLPWPHVAKSGWRRFSNRP